jgi:uncharacterized protein (TIGR00375 family)
LKYIADLHIHSPFSRATSKASHLFGLASWAALKGIHVIGTGDFTHPGWLNHLTWNLEEAEPGFFRLKQRKDDRFTVDLPDGLHPDTDKIRFVLTSEISSIYKRGGRVRKVHNIVFAPDFESVRRMNAVLAGIGNIESDGRPILGLDSRDLLEIVLEEVPEGFLVPAHIWTPWFSLFGSKSGFDSLEECFGDLSDHIFALETGLSSDPDMNRCISALDRYTLISNSDCHSPGKLGREANIFTTDFDFFAMREAIRVPRGKNGGQLFEATVEFYPEEGKYHCDGHRKCGVCQEPGETRDNKGVCPVCGRPVTVGVLNRVMELADRTSPVYPEGSPGVHSLVPLVEILGELLQTSPATKRVAQAYSRLIHQFGPEFDILLKTDIPELEKQASPVLAEAVRRVRAGQVIRRPGFDGEFGVIKVFSEGERSGFAGQLNLFGLKPQKPRRKTAALPVGSTRKKKTPLQKKKEKVKKLNPEQQEAVDSDACHIIVQAGPGTGKTHTLVQRVIRLVRQKDCQCTVITFTNKAADELQHRIHSAVGSSAAESVFTLHGYCLKWLRSENPAIRVVGPDMRRWMLRSVLGGATAETRELEQEISLFLRNERGLPVECPPLIHRYFRALDREGLVDIDAVIPRAIQLLNTPGPFSQKMKQATGALFIDEFQDLNRSQYELIRILAETSPVFAIGDPDQAIYGFRGSSSAWFGKFIASFNPEQHVLCRNYRSSSQIVDAASEVIQKNSRTMGPVRTRSALKQQGRIFLHRSLSPRAEAGFVVRQIESLIGGSSHREIDRLTTGCDSNISLSDIAVLYRTGRQAKVLADVLLQHGFPVQVVDILPFYRSGPAFILYLYVVITASQSELSDIIAILKHEKGLAGAELAGYEQIFPVGLANPLDSLSGIRKNCTEEQYARLEEIHDFALKLRTEAVHGVEQALKMIVSEVELDSGDPDVIRFFRLGENFETSLQQFADHLQRYGDSLIYDERADAVTLMTLHAAKGLEFQVVFLAGMEEGLVPLSARRSLTREEEVQHIEEERRLFYVGMTRAANTLYLSHVEKRQVKGEVVRQERSRFVDEIPAGFLTAPVKNDKGAKRPGERARQLSLF